MCSAPIPFQNIVVNAIPKVCAGHQKLICSHNKLKAHFNEFLTRAGISSQIELIGRIWHL